jgi:hypothetical protein
MSCPGSFPKPGGTRCGKQTGRDSGTTKKEWMDEIGRKWIENGRSLLQAVQNKPCKTYHGEIESTIDCPS